MPRHNDRTFGLLQADPRYADFHQSALVIAQSHDRIPIEPRSIYDARLSDAEVERRQRQREAVSDGGAAT